MPLYAMEKEQKLHRQWIAALIATMSTFMMGMFLGWPSPTLQTLRSPHSQVHLTEDQISWMISVLYVGSTLSPLFTGWLMDAWGRKTTLLVLSSTALSSWLILIFAQSPIGIYIARFLGGMWGGSAYTVAPVYLSEIADARVRGSLNSLFILMVYIGIMFEYAIGPQVSYTGLSVVSAFVPVTFMLALTWAPESPYYHLMKKNHTQAANTLAWLRCKKSASEVEPELALMEKAVTADMQNPGRLSDLVSTPGNRKALLIAEVLAVLQRMSGVSVIMAYASAAIPQTGGFTPNDCAILMCAVWIVLGLISTFFVDWIGRRILMAISCAGCALGNALITVYFYLDSNTEVDVSQISWLPFFSLLIYAVFFPIGLGCVPQMIQGEMFPSNTRGLASGVTSTVISLTSFLTNKLYTPLGDSVGLYINYAIFSVSCLLGVIFCLTVMLETRGKTLENIQCELAQQSTRDRTLENIQYELVQQSTRGAQEGVK